MMESIGRYIEPHVSIVVKPYPKNPMLETAVYPINSLKSFYRRKTGYYLKYRNFETNDFHNLGPELTVTVRVQGDRLGIFTDLRDLKVSELADENKFNILNQEISRRRYEFNENLLKATRNALKEIYPEKRS